MQHVRRAGRRLDRTRCPRPSFFGRTGRAYLSKWRGIQRTSEFRVLRRILGSKLCPHKLARTYLRVSNSSHVPRQVVSVAIYAKPRSTLCRLQRSCTCIYRGTLPGCDRGEVYMLLMCTPNGAVRARSIQYNPFNVHHEYVIDIGVYTYKNSVY